MSTTEVDDVEPATTPPVNPPHTGSVATRRLGMATLVLLALNRPVAPPAQTSEFLSHVTRIVVRLRALGVPILAHRTTHPYQVSVRFREGLATDGMWFVIADALRQAGLDLMTPGVELVQQLREIPGVAGVHMMAHRHHDLVAQIVTESGVLAGRAALFAARGTAGVTQ